MPRHPRPNKLRHFFLRRKSSPARVQVPTPPSLRLRLPPPATASFPPVAPPARPTDRQDPTTAAPLDSSLRPLLGSAGRRRSIRRAASPETIGLGLGVSSARLPVVVRLRRT